MGLLEEGLTEQIIGSAIEVHRNLGPGLLESAYQFCLAREFQLRGISFAGQVELPVIYKGHSAGASYRIDFLVADRIVVELKSVERLLPVHEAQLLTYMKLTQKRVGLLINFNMSVLKRGILRRVI